ncbi:hypothetical protein [Salipiger mucosus]|uniref:SPOR domain-containing protein n=1 Tax=Salipiger mucosus DSM 16094 TaxID=1123237 RepID=S9QKW3_9RHOB|nr:hypothetical protein [Salipiger mucosus]EPX82071.1 hypothetical protein Salmuc_02438 [Salipiger mucosus DSM 16094]
MSGAPYAVARLARSSDGKVVSQRYPSREAAERAARYLADKKGEPFVVLSPEKPTYPGDRSLGLFDS